jgi:hypothetical protein
MVYAATGNEARRFAASRGWSVTRVTRRLLRDFCPACSDHAGHKHATAAEVSADTPAMTDQHAR